MLYVLVATLIGVCLIGYVSCEKDFFTPTVAQVMGFIFSGLMCIIFMSNMKYKIHINTVALIISCLAISIFIGCITHQIFKKIRIKKINYGKQEIKEFPISIHIFVLLFQVGVVFWQWREIKRISGGQGSFNAIMMVFRERNSYSTDAESQLPFLLRQLMPVMYAIAASYLLYIIKCYSSMSIHSKIICFVIVINYCISSLLTGARGSLINLFLAAIMFYHMVRIQKRGGYKKYKLSSIIRLIVCVMLAVWFFSVTRSFVGRQSRSNFLDYVSGYAGTSILNLDLYLQSPWKAPDVWGKWTFQRLIYNLRILGIIHVKPYLVHYEFRRIDGVSTGNVYTLFRDYYNDFGVAGTFILHGLASLLASILYEYGKRKPSNKTILLNGYLYNSLVMSFYTERFFDLTFSISFVRNVVILMIVSTVLFKRPFRIVAKTRTHIHLNSE